MYQSGSNTSRCPYIQREPLAKIIQKEAFKNGQGKTYHERNTGAELHRRTTRRGVNYHLRKGEYIGIGQNAILDLLLPLEIIVSFQL